MANYYCFGIINPGLILWDKPSGRVVSWHFFVDPNCLSYEVSWAAPASGFSAWYMLQQGGPIGIFPYGSSRTFPMEVVGV